MSRGVLRTIWNNFLNSFKVEPRKYFGEFKGEDHLGNKYFELPPDPQGGRRLSSRWFEAVDPSDTTPEVPREWIAWLRRQRDVPPTQEEIILNMAKADLKRTRAAEINKKYGHQDINDKSSPFRQYPEYKTKP